MGVHKEITNSTIEHNFYASLIISIFHRLLRGIKKLLSEDLVTLDPVLISHA